MPSAETRAATRVDVTATPAPFATASAWTRFAAIAYDEPKVRLVSMMHACIVCEEQGPRRFAQIGARVYWRCDRCEATFVDASQHPARIDEFTHYLLHENDVDDLRYRRFLNKLASPLLERLPPRSSGLDYGCGPGPALGAMLREAGHRVTLFDPFFAPDATALQTSYDFVTCTETAEHFHRPADEFRRLTALVRPGGWLAVMTSFQTDDTRFADWHYRHDPTHVVFYREATFHRLASQLGWACDVPTKDVALLRAPTVARPR